LWDVETGEEKAVFPFPNRINNAQFSHDGQTLAIGTDKQFTLLHGPPDQSIAAER
jgi:galactose mutarotase-like enzyme